MRLRISVLSAASGDGAVLDIQGRGQDVWGPVPSFGSALQAGVPRVRIPHAPSLEVAICRAFLLSSLPSLQRRQHVCEHGARTCRVLSVASQVRSSDVELSTGVG